MNSCTWRAPSLSSATDVVDPGTPADVASGQQAQEAAMPTDGRWRIVNKYFAHTGGEIPQEE